MVVGTASPDVRLPTTMSQGFVSDCSSPTWWHILVINLTIKRFASVLPEARELIVRDRAWLTSVLHGKSRHICQWDMSTAPKHYPGIKWQTRANIICHRIRIFQLEHDPFYLYPIALISIH